MYYLLFVGIILSILWLIFASFNKFSVLLSAPVAVVVVVLFSGVGLTESLFDNAGSYVYYLADFVKDFIFIFILGSIMAKYLQLSGGIQTISSAAVKIIDVKNPMHGMITVFLITSILTYGGVSLFVVMFAAVPLARSLFSKMNIPWKLAPLPIILGLGTFTAGTIPGSPSVINVIPTKTLGTNLMAAPFMGLAATTVMIVVSVAYMHYVVKSEMKNGNELITEELEQDQPDHRPGIFLSLLPIFMLILIIILGSSFNVDNILIIALTAVIIVESFVYNKYIISHVHVVNAGTSDALIPLLSTASTIAYGSFIAANSIVSDFTRQFIDRFSNKLLTGSIVTVVFSIITASASGAIGIIMATQGTYFIDLGLNADTVHRVLSTASTLAPNMPHSGVVIALLTLSNLSHKEAFKHLLIAPFLVGAAGLLVSLLLA
ncbi:GntP family permease [Proteiniclasticum sp. C24MP]|uniref:GntP family permease n=1 Tax=Proteiniclasticum sp. C24MP TaxID=3374101 RepID=UPI00375452D8